MQSRSLPSLHTNHSIAGIAAQLSAPAVHLPPVIIDPSSPTCGGHRIIPPLSAQDLMIVYPTHNTPSGPPHRERYFAAQEREFFTRTNNNSQTHLFANSTTSFGDRASSQRASQSPVPSSPSSVSSLSSLSALSSPASSGPSEPAQDIRIYPNQSYQQQYGSHLSLPSTQNALKFDTNNSSPDLQAVPQNPPTIYIHIPPAECDDDSSRSSPASSPGRDRRLLTAGRKQSNISHGRGMSCNIGAKMSGVDGGKGFGVLMPPPPALGLRFVGVDVDCSSSSEPSFSVATQPSPMTFIPLAKKGSGAPGRGPTRRARRWF